ncbi:BofC C-terminal domain-containing protein [Bacillus sp. 1P06AnD]|uniref:BofC C-terminal domain-containing protein n=1 Tax=Bacillus sp. 1P06AnD TaxID=3132208 RepID=UPI0039A3766C
MKRRIGKIGYISFLLVILLLLYASVSLGKGGSATAKADEIRKVTLQKIYLDGEVTEETAVKETKSIEELHVKYHNWNLVFESDKELVYQKHINDISPLLKAHGYFGITEDGTLSIFNGKPTNLDVIQTFFQLDVDLLEVKKRDELAEGIKVKDKKRYQSVLETFKQYKDERLR